MEPEWPNFIQYLSQDYNFDESFGLFMLWDTIQLSKKDVKEQEKFIRDEKSLFDDPNVIIVEEIDPTKDLFYSIVGQIENAIPA